MPDIISLLRPGRIPGQAIRAPRLYLVSGRRKVQPHHLEYTLKPFFEKHSQLLSNRFTAGLDLELATDEHAEISDQDFLLWLQPQLVDDRQTRLASQMFPRFSPANTAIVCYENPVGYHFRRWILGHSTYRLAGNFFSSVALLTDSQRHHWIPAWNYLIDFLSDEPITAFAREANEGRTTIAVNPVGNGLQLSAERIEIIDYFLKELPECRLFGSSEVVGYSRLAGWSEKYGGQIPWADPVYPYRHKIPVFREAKFVLVVENLFADGYVTEKLAEPLAALSLPIYFGNPRIAEYLPELFIDGVINGHDFSSLEELKMYIKSMSDDDYRRRIDTILRHRDRYFYLTSYRRIWDFVLSKLLAPHLIDSSSALPTVNRWLTEIHSSEAALSERDQLISLAQSVCDKSLYDRSVRELLWLQARKQLPGPFNTWGPLSLGSVSAPVAE